MFSKKITAIVGAFMIGVMGLSHALIVQADTKEETMETTTVSQENAEESTEDAPDASPEVIREPVNGEAPENVTTTVVGGEEAQTEDVSITSEKETPTLYPELDGYQSPLMLMRMSFEEGTPGELVLLYGGYFSISEFKRSPEYRNDFDPMWMYLVNSKKLKESEAK